MRLDERRRRRLAKLALAIVIVGSTLTIAL